jgi:hypothetical protein
MQKLATILANIENFGRIYRCGDCDNIHVQVGPVTVLLSIEAFMEFVTLVNTSAANFESAITRTCGDAYHDC